MSDHQLDAIVAGVRGAVEDVVSRINEDLKDLSATVRELDSRQRQEQLNRVNGQVEVRAEVQLLTHTIGSVRELVQDLRKEQASFSAQRETLVEIGHALTDVQAQVEQVKSEADKDLGTWRERVGEKTEFIENRVSGNKRTIEELGEKLDSVIKTLDNAASERKGMARAVKIAAGVVSVGGTIGIADLLNIVKIGMEK